MRRWLAYGLRTARYALCPSPASEAFGEGGCPTDASVSSTYALCPMLYALCSITAHPSPPVSFQRHPAAKNTAPAHPPLLHAEALRRARSYP